MRLLVSRRRVQLNQGTTITNHVDRPIQPEVSAHSDVRANTVIYIIEYLRSDHCAAIDSAMDIDYAAGCHL